MSAEGRWSELPLHLVVPFLNSFRHLHFLACVDRSTHAKLVSDLTARSHWVDLAVTLTSYPNRGFIPEKIRESLADLQQDRTGFFDYVRALVCPWTSRPDIFPMNRFFVHTFPAKYMLLSADASRLIFQTGNTDEVYQSSCPSIISETWQEGLVYQEILVPQQASELDFTEEVSNMLSRPINMFDFTCTKTTEANFAWFPVHGSVVAVMAFFNKKLTSPPEGDNGIYFFSTTDNRMLAHWTMDYLDLRDRSFMQSKPGQLWLLMNGRVVHYYQHTSQSKRIHEPNVVLSKKPERMDMALCLAGSGDAEGAVEFFRRDLDCLNINTRNVFNRRSLVHYAAKAGHFEAVGKLIEASADPWMKDYNGFDALILACKGFHHETVRVIVDSLGDGTGLSEKRFLGGWNQMCDMRIQDLCDGLDEDSVRYRCRTAVPEIVRTLLFNKNPGQICFEMLLMKALSSPTILASSEAVGVIFRSGGEHIRQRFANESKFRFFFFPYMNTVMELEAMETLKMIVDEFDFDVNYKRGVTQETCLIWAVRNGSVVAVKTLVEDLRADITARCNAGKDIRGLAVRRCVKNPSDEEASNVLKYIGGLLRQI